MTFIWCRLSLYCFQVSFSFVLSLEQILSPRIGRVLVLLGFLRKVWSIYYDPLTWWIQTPNSVSPAVIGSWNTGSAFSVFKFLLFSRFLGIFPRFTQKQTSKGNLHTDLESYLPLLLLIFCDFCPQFERLWQPHTLLLNLKPVNCCVWILVIQSLWDGGFS